MSYANSVQSVTHIISSPCSVNGVDKLARMGTDNTGREEIRVKLMLLQDDQTEVKLNLDEESTFLRFHNVTVLFFLAVTDYWPILLGLLPDQDTTGSS